MAGPDDLYIAAVALGIPVSALAPARTLVKRKTHKPAEALPREIGKREVFAPVHPGKPLLQLLPVEASAALDLPGLHGPQPVRPFLPTFARTLDPPDTVPRKGLPGCRKPARADWVFPDPLLSDAHSFWHINQWNRKER